MGQLHRRKAIRGSYLSGDKEAESEEHTRLHIPLALWPNVGGELLEDPPVRLPLLGLRYLDRSSSDICSRLHWVFRRFRFHGLDD